MDNSSLFDLVAACQKPGSNWRILILLQFSTLRWILIKEFISISLSDWKTQTIMLDNNLAHTIIIGSFTICMNGWQIYISVYKRISFQNEDVEIIFPYIYTCIPSKFKLYREHYAFHCLQHLFPRCILRMQLSILNIFFISFKTDKI